MPNRNARSESSLVDSGEGGIKKRKLIDMAIETTHDVNYKSSSSFAGQHSSKGSTKSGAVKKTSATSSKQLKSKDVPKSVTKKIKKATTTTKRTTSPPAKIVIKKTMAAKVAPRKMAAYMASTKKAKDAATQPSSKKVPKASKGRPPATIKKKTSQFVQKEVSPKKKKVAVTSSSTSSSRSVNKKMASKKVNKDKSSGKKFGFWRGGNSRRHRRMASLNAQAKVHILYENEARSPVDQSGSAQQQDSDAGGIAGRSSSPAEQVTRNRKNNDTKTGKMAAVKKRKAPPIDDVRFQVLAPKRMASLNAQAILAASYSLDRFRKEKVVQVTSLPPPLPHPPSPPVVETVTSAETTTKSMASSPDQDDTVDTIMQVINAVACREFDEDDCCAVTSKTKKKVSRTSNKVVDKDMDSNHAAVAKRPSKKSCSMTCAVGVTMPPPPQPPPPPTVVAPPPHPPRPKSPDHDQTEPLNLMRTKSPSAVVCSEPTNMRRANTSGGIVVVPAAPVDVCSLLVVDEAPSFVSSQAVGTTTFDMDNQTDYQKAMSPPTAVGFLPVKDHHHHSLESGNKVVEVKTEAIRRDKIEDTAEVTITGMYINPVTNTSQSFCISRIHTYKQATSTHSCYSPPNVASVGVIDLHQAQPQPQPQPPQPQPALLTSSSVAASGGQLLHGAHMGLHHSGEGHVYPYATSAAAASANQAPPPAAPPGGMDAAGGISRHYGSAFTVPHYGHHQPLPYGYYQPAGPMIQTLTTTTTADPSSCLIHKPVPFHASGHPFAGNLSGSGQQQQQQSSNSGQQQPFPVDQCRAHPTAPAYPPPGPGPGPGRQQQVYAGGGGGVVISGATATAAPPSSALSSPPPPSSASAATCGASGTVGGAATAATAADSKSASGNVARAAPPPPSELYFADGCQSCCAAAAAAAIHASSSPVQRQHEQQRQRSGGQHYARPSRGSPSSAPPPPSPSASATAAVAARFHRLPPSAMSNKGGGIDQQDANGYRKALAALPLPSHTKAVKMESSSAGVDVAADLQDGYANPAIAAAAKTPSNSGRNGRQQMHLHRNKSSPPSADVVSVATSNGQRVAHIGHATPKEARLTVSLEDVLRKTSSSSSSSSSSSGTTTTTTAAQWTQQQRQLYVDVGLRRPLRNEDDDDDDDSEEERRRRLSTHNGGLLTRSKTLELARTNADCVMKTRSAANGLTAAAAKRSSECCRSKYGIRDVTNERRPSSSASMMTKLEERTRNGFKRNNQLLPSPTTRRNNSNGGTFSLLIPPSPSPQLSPTTRSSRSTATSKGPSVRRLSVPCLKWNSSSSQSQSSSTSSTSLDAMTVMTQNHAPKISRVAKKVLRYSNGWTWEGSPSKKAVYLTNDDPPVIRWCYSSMRHEQGDVIRARDCILLKSGPRKADLPYVAKVAALWENPEDGEMMVSMLWYYRPEHTEQGRRPHHMVDEIFASKHRDVNSVACIEDKCHVLTFNEYCRYKCRIRILDAGTRPNLSLVADLEDGYPRKERQPPGRISSDLVFFCRKVYDFRQKRILKNPS